MMRPKKFNMDIYEEIGIGADTMIALASGGDFTKDYSHEFQNKMRKVVRTLSI